MELKELLSHLASIDETQMDEEDKAILAEIATKYDLGEEEPEEDQPIAPDPSPEHEAQESPAQEAQEHLTGEEAMEPGEAGQVPPQPTEEMPANAEAPVGEEDIAAALAQTEQPQATPPQDDAMLSLQDEIASLRESIDGIKSMLEKVSIREPITEEQAEKAENSVGMKGKPGKAVESQPNMTDMLARKLGGF